ncbi:MAG: bifunctional hydroxymethylpyrimidine kinase/phosphomethylpyrimidine kinase [Endozoicomonadaceae bacterium]|nr:bifunctional hydroxymethylpyrimidine kinase/phosphomethylpyrimidine kinase [Endozoicomonadaceae bacterium]
MKTPIALTIAGSDSSGGAGIQADIKAFSALGTYGCSVITALTAQNTLGVQGIVDIEPAFICQQLDSVFYDLDVQAIKIGMLSRTDSIEVVVERLEEQRDKHIVFDPVMVATSNDRLLQDEAITTLKKSLIPMASLITPNLKEAAVLLNCPVPKTTGAMGRMVEPLMALGCQAVLIKGGHLEEEESIDILFDGTEIYHLRSPRIQTKNTHGTGCTLSSAITALLAQNFSLVDAVRTAKDYIDEAIAHADTLSIGHGHGPVHHFHHWWPCLATN